MTTKEKFETVFAYFSKTMPAPATELKYKDPYELLVAVILSAQCSDKRVNMITPHFFTRYPDPESLSKAKLKDIFSIIKSCSYPNNKSKHLLGMAKKLSTDFKGIIPADTELLQQLPGVGRKTAHVIASVLFGKPTLAVDTHVFRVSDRIGLTKNAKNPLDCEKQLVKHIPDKLISTVHHWLILHGRYTCKARKPLCQNCGLSDLCQYYKNTIINHFKAKVL